ncbi:hypothetical protein COY95_02985, partial [Candidatus Woesearchaeota archaeon CG_4_10_14_0_8_um_filter_47_5]
MGNTEVPYRIPYSFTSFFTPIVALIAIIALGGSLFLCTVPPVQAVFVDPEVTLSLENHTSVPVIVFLKVPRPPATGSNLVSSEATNPGSQLPQASPAPPNSLSNTSPNTPPNAPPPSPSAAEILEHQRGVRDTQKTVLSRLKTIYPSEKKIRVITITQPDIILKDNYSVIPAFSGNLTTKGLKKLEQDPLVDAIFHDGIFSLGPLPPEEPRADAAGAEPELAYGSPAIGAPYAWNRLNMTGRNVTIAIIDTGIDYTHSVFGSCSAIGPDCRVKGGYDFYNNDNNPMDDHGHGTHCAGIAAGDHQTYKGVAYEADLLAVKVLNSAGSGYWSDIIEGVDWSVTHGADVISMSLGGNPYYTSPYSLRGTAAVARAVDEAVSLGVVAVIAAGNSGPGTATIATPG